MPINFNPFVPSVRTGGPVFNPTFPFGGSSSAANCAPVYIRDYNGNTIAIVESGGTYDINPVTFVRAITFKAGSAYSVSFISLGSGNISVLSSTNIASAVYTNRTTATVVVPPYHVTRNDVVTITVVPTNPAIDSVLVLQGVFDSVTVSVTDVNLGFNGLEGYNVNEASKNISVFDTVTDLEIIRPALDAASTHTAAVYRGIDDTVYIWGFSGANTLTLQKLNCVTNVVGAMTSYAATNIGFNPVCACYNYIQDKFIIVGGGGASCPIVIFDPVTLTVTAIALIDLFTATSIQYMGFADKLEDSFFIGAGLLTAICLRYIPSTGKFEDVMTILRGGSAAVTFNTTNRFLYGCETNGGPRWYNPTVKPEVGFVATTTIRRGGMCFEPVYNRIFGTDVTSRQYGMFDIGTSTVTAFAPAAVGAETGYRCCEYNHYTGKIYITSRAGNMIRSLSPVTGAIINTITTGNQNTLTTGGLNQLAFRRIKL